jgi:hypothetical protein
MVAPVLSFTGSPTVKPPAVALVLAPAEAAESAPVAGGVADESDDGAVLELSGAALVSLEAGGVALDEDEPLVVVGVDSANAWVAIAMASPAAVRRKVVRSMGISLI